MGKPNTYVQLKTAQRQLVQMAYDMERMKGFTLQQSLDMAQITLHEYFRFGPERCREFGEKFMETFRDYAELCISDGEDDAEIAYTKGVLDRSLTAACGKIIPFDERYSDENLYFKGDNNKGRADASDKKGD